MKILNEEIMGIPGRIRESLMEIEKMDNITEIELKEYKQKMGF
jgi:hypothetical protein